MLDDKLYTAGLLLFVLVDNDNRLGIVWHLLVYNWSCILWALESAEEFLYLGFCMVYINVAHNNDGLVLRVIPLVVVVGQLLILEVVYNRHQTDRVANTILRSRIEFRQITLKHTA